MSWLQVLNHAVKVGIFANDVVSNFNSSQKLQTIIDKYEIEHCDSVNEIEKKLERLKTEAPDDYTLFNKEYPDMHKYLKHAKEHPGTPFNE
jgi:ABC-type transporter lipoprotein component MlaA